MATSDKHCQTLIIKSAKIIESIAAGDDERGMYDETVDVVNAREIDSPSSSEDAPVKANKPTMSKFNPPTRHLSRHSFDSDSESDSDRDNFVSKFPGDNQQVSDKSRQSTADGKTRPEIQRRQSKEGSGRKKKDKVIDSSENSETDSNDLGADKAKLPLGGTGSGRKRGAGVVIPAEGAYDPKKFHDLKVPADMENIFQYIMKYTPQKIDIDFKLQPFVPEYVPAVGDIDAFIKVTTPACNVRGADISDNVLEFIDNLGLMLLDEPAAEQSDSALLHLQLRAISKTSSAKSNILTKKIENAEKNSKAIERWIKDVSELHLSKPAPNVTYSGKMPDVDSLMEEWPESMEQVLNESGFPPASLDCSLGQYVDLVCGIFDIPVAGDTLNDRIQALHLLFSLYSAVKNSQLYAERQKEEKADSNV